MCMKVRTALDPLVNDADVDSDGDGLTNLEEFNLGLAANDPDSDGDGIQDGLDPVPNLANNLCSGADSVLENQAITTDVICAGSNSVTIDGTVETQLNGDLRVISPTVEFKPGFSVEAGGTLKVQSVHPCSVCP